MSPELSEDDSRTASFPRKRARVEYAGKNGAASTLYASTIKRQKKTGVDKQDVQESGTQGCTFNRHGEVFAIEDGKLDKSAGEDEAGSTEESVGVIDVRNSSLNGIESPNPEQRNKARRVSKMNWNTGVRSVIRTAFNSGGSKSVLAKPSLDPEKLPDSGKKLDVQSTRTQLFGAHLAAGQEVGIDGIETDLAGKLEGKEPAIVNREYVKFGSYTTFPPDKICVRKEATNTSNNPPQSNIHEALISQNQAREAVKGSTDGDERGNTIQNSFDGGDSSSVKSSARSPVVAFPRRNPVPIKKGCILEYLRGIYAFEAGGVSYKHSTSEWVASDAYKKIRGFLKECPTADNVWSVEVLKRNGRQKIYESKKLGHMSKSFKQLDQELQECSLEDLRAHLFSFDLALPWRPDQAELIHAREPDVGAQPVETFIQQLDEQTATDLPRRETIHEIEVALTEQRIVGYQYDQLMSILLTPQELQERGIGMLALSRTKFLPQDYREQLLQSCSDWSTNRTLSEDDGSFARMKDAINKVMHEYGLPPVGRAGQGSDALSSCSTSDDINTESESDSKLREKIHKVETDYWTDKISRDVYNAERLKLYTDEEVKEARIEWPRREVHSPAGYRESELDFLAEGGLGRRDWNDALFEFGYPPDERGDEKAAEKRWRDGVEREFKSPKAKMAEYKRWEKIRELEREYYHHRIPRDQYNEQRFALYTEGEKKERGIVWPHKECQSPAGYRDDIFGQFESDEPDWKSRMDFHWPFALQYTDTTGEENLCDLCVALIEEHRVMLKNQEEGREALRKVEREKHVREELLEKQRVEKKREEKARTKSEREALTPERSSHQIEKKKKKKKKKESANAVDAPQSVQNTTEVEQTEKDKSEEILEDRVTGSAESSKDEGEVSDSLNSKSDRASRPLATSQTHSRSSLASRYSPPGPGMAPIQYVRDLDDAGKELQLRYFPCSNNNSDRLVKCLVCAGEGHVAEVCPELRCRTCGAVDSHFTYACPKIVRCERCHETGHTIASCTSKLARSAADGLFCTLCQQHGHFDNMCSRIWRTVLPPDTVVKKVESLPIFCYSCGDEGHFGADCVLQPAGQPAESLLGGSTFSMKNARQFLPNNYQPDVRLKFSIRGRATHQVREDSEPEDFLRPPVITNMHDRRPDIRVGGGTQIWRDDLSRASDRPTHCRQGAGHRDHGSPRQDRSLATNSYRPPPRRQRSPSPLPRYQREDRRDYTRERDGGRFYSGGVDRYQPPLPREPLPPTRGRGGSQRIGGGESYRPLPSAARNAKKQFRR